MNIKNVLFLDVDNKPFVIDHFQIWSGMNSKLVGYFIKPNNEQLYFDVVKMVQPHDAVNAKEGGLFEKDVIVYVENLSEKRR